MNRVIPEEACALESDNDNIPILICLIVAWYIVCSNLLLNDVLMQLEALVHPFFDELRDPNTRLPNGRFLPPLFNFKAHGNNHSWNCDFLL